MYAGRRKKNQQIETTDISCLHILGTLYTSNICTLEADTFAWRKQVDGSLWRKVFAITRLDKHIRTIPGIELGTDSNSQGHKAEYPCILIGFYDPSTKTHRGH